MATLDAFLPYVRLSVSGLPAPVLIHEIRSACIRFCERTRVWRGMESLDVVADQASYPIPVPLGAQLQVLEEVYLCGDRLQATALDDLKSRWTNWLAVAGTPLVYTQLTPDELTLVPKPVVDLAEGLVMRAAYKPTRDAGVVPDFLFDQYAPVIASGALAVLFGQPDLPCYNPDQALFHQGLFDQGMDKALTRADRSFTRAPRRTVARFL